MPRSRNPDAYPEFFHKLLTTFYSAPNDSYNFRLPTGRAAIDLKNQWYAFRRALEEQSARLRKAGDIPTSSTYQTHYRLSLQWSALIRPKPPSYKLTAPYRRFLDEPAGLTFVNISSQPEFVDLAAQLASQLPPAPIPNDIIPDKPANTMADIIRDTFMPPYPNLTDEPEDT